MLAIVICKDIISL